MKEKIIEINKRLGLNTEFIIDEKIQGYSIGKTIYINEMGDIEKINKHELLHFYEETESFKKIKEKILEDNKEKIDKIREAYELRYYGLYSKEEIENGIIDTEIVIDIMIDNYVIEYSEGIKIGEYALGEIEKELEYTRYLNMSITNNIKNMNLDKWEKLFVLNFYDGKEHIMPSKENRKEKIKEDIKKELERLYNLKEEDLRIYKKSEEVYREYKSEIKALKQRGEETSYIERNKDSALKEIADKYSETLYEEYKHIVDYIKGTQYEEAFKVLMLRETLEKTYKIDEENKIIKKRDIHHTITGHMIINDIVLDTIYNNIDNYDNFGNLYFAGLNIFNNKISEKSEIKLDNVETYNMGKWIKFEGKESNNKKYIENSKELASLVKDTPWCTKTLASEQLSQGDFYVFIDNKNKPHIAVKMSGNEIDEVRGILNGNAQELEEDYRKVAISFLENNQEIKNGKEWLRKEEWNKRLLNHIKNIEEETLTKEEVPQLIDDLFGNYEYKSHSGENTNKTKLKKLLPRISKPISEYYECSEEEICFDDIDFESTNYKTVPYKIIFGYAYFENSKITDLGNLINIGGYANFKDSQITSLGNLTSIGGNAYFGNSKVTDLGNLTSIGGNADFKDSQITSLGNLTTIGDFADFENSQITALGNLTTIGENAYFENSQITNLGNLTTIGGNADFEDSQITNLGNLTTIGGRAHFGHSQVTNLGNLITIGGNAYFKKSKITSLGNLTTIGGNAYFENSKITDLGNLTSIGGNAYFENSQITSLGNLTTIGGFAIFENSQITSLGNLKKIGRSAIFSKDKIIDLGNLQYVGERIYCFENMLANNLEFDTLEEFKEYFYNKNKEGESKIGSLSNSVGRQ